MKKLILYLCLLICATNLYSQKRAPANPDYYKYIKDVENGLIQTTEDGYVLNYMPMYSSMPELTGGYNINRKKSSEFEFLPYIYDLRNKKSADGSRNLLGAVRNQGKGSYGGNCWCFASIGAIESNWLLRQTNEPLITYNGVLKELEVYPEIDSKLNLSEQNLASQNKFQWGYGQGGNTNMALAYFSRLQGPLLEADDAYNSSKPRKTNVVGVAPVAFVPEVRWIYSNDVKGLKHTILYEGGVTAEMYMNPSILKGNKYQYKGLDIANHMIMLVGWNDTLEMEDKTKGAWIARNSWGTGFGENGFFYIAYNDSRISFSRNTYYPTRWEAINASTGNPTVKAMYYDTLGIISNYGFNQNTAYALVKFEIKTPKKTLKVVNYKTDFITTTTGMRKDTIKTNNITTYKVYTFKDAFLDTIAFDSIITSSPRNILPQKIKAIGTFAILPGEEFDIDIYNKFPVNDTSGLVFSQKRLRSNLQGFYAFDAPAIVYDSVFYVKIKYLTPGWNYPIPCEEVTDSTFAKPHIQPSGMQWISADGKSWQKIGSDIPSRKFDVSLKVYLDYDSLMPSLAFNINKKEVCPGSNVVFENLSKVKGNVQYSWDFGSGAAIKTAQGFGPHTVKIAEDAMMYAGVRHATLSAHIIDSVPVYKQFTKVYNFQRIVSSKYEISQTKKVNDTTFYDVIKKIYRSKPRNVFVLYENDTIIKWRQRDTTIQTKRTYQVVDGVSLKLFAVKSPVRRGDTIQLLAVADADSFTWQPGYKNDKLKHTFIPNANTAFFTASDTGNFSYSVLALQKGKTLISDLPGCPGFAELNFKVIAPPVNDEVCNAIPLKYGKNGVFTNVDATVEGREPLPVEGDSTGISTCNTPKKWCSEGGLQNSVWFTFVPEFTGLHSFNTKGFDTQIAIYRSDSCNSIVIKDLIAANDDYHTSPADSFAAAIDTVTLIKGKKYFIQIDGSAGGASGRFYITIGREFFLKYTPPVSNNKSITILPNPNKGSFNVDLTQTEENFAFIEIYEINGRIVKQYKVERAEADTWIKSIDTGLPLGVYLVKVTGTGISQTSKLLIQ